MRKKIAIIGSGISGLTCGYLLHKDHDITLFEANDYIGGHTATKQVEVDGKHYDIDTGFIVFNDWTYPHFIKLMDQIGVTSQPTEMSFSVKNSAHNLEYNGNNLNSLFAQRRNIFRPTFWRMVNDILTFNKACKALNISEVDESKTLFGFVEELGLSDTFANNYILPMCAAIWSASIEQTKQFPLRFFLQFFNNHGLLNITNRPQWYTIVGGSSTYIEPLTAGFKQHIRLQSPVHAVTRNEATYNVQTKSGEVNTFDEVIFACHSDQALAMLSEPTAEQADILGAIPYEMNEVVLHTDTALLPQRRLAWASWNYLIKGIDNENQQPASVTYNMNILQRLTAPHTFCVTLNNTKQIDPDKILGVYQYAHPQYNHTMVKAQQRRSAICGVNGLHFCGAYWYNGFHEDGVKSALDVCKRFGTSL
ncbi:NAD(P)/FAD-dependent oxidoreductase [Alteromonas facilis]|uniref:NAD(P)/FAD-dependent oxidoreductase n=1 Tax=Alteromonas facilis TaxID=2048004 RepID=UPI000C29475F|nr:FAD-dependent oxidoreductase [Alteromonas facilis]